MPIDERLRGVSDAGLSPGSVQTPQAPHVVPSIQRLGESFGGSEGLASRTHKFRQAGPIEASQPRPAKGIVEAFVITCQRWGVSQQERAILLGYSDPQWAEPLILGRIPVRNQDVRDRIGYIVAISLGLGALYNEDASAELNWLRRVHEQLQEAPLSFMLRGHLRNLITVSEIVRRKRGI